MSAGEVDLNHTASSTDTNHNKADKTSAAKNSCVDNNTDQSLTSHTVDVSTRTKTGWGDEQLMMFHWLIKQGYDFELAKKLVIAAFNIEQGYNPLIGRVIRSSNSATPVRWEGELPSRDYVNPSFSRKVFIGGVPWDITEADLLKAFEVYGSCSVEWPNQSLTDLKSSRSSKAVGYVYIIFAEEDSIRKLLKDCTREYGSAGEYHFKIFARRARASTEIRQVQIIPWVIADSVHVVDATAKIDRGKTVFVGALHGMITSQILYSIMNDVYGSVVFVCLDNDKYKYPIGSGRVTFASYSSFIRAVEDGFLEIKTSKFTKKIQIDPFLEYSACSQCLIENGTYFCRNRSCFKHFCARCWEVYHLTVQSYGPHKAVIRRPKRTTANSRDLLRENLKVNFNEEWLPNRLSIIRYCPRGEQATALYVADALPWIAINGIPLLKSSSEQKSGQFRDTRKSAALIPKKIRLPIKTSFCSVDSSDGPSQVGSTTSGEGGEDYAAFASENSSDFASSSC